MLNIGKEANLIIVRGPAGSGKSTLAEVIRKSIGGDAVRVEADLYFYDDINYKYNFDPKQLKEAHKWCRNQVAKLLRDHRTVILSNCNTFITHLGVYIDLAEFFDARITVYECTNNFGSIHAPPEVSARMRKDFQPLSQYPKVQQRIRTHNLYLDNIGGSQFLEAQEEEFLFAEEAKDERLKEMELGQ
tara:strand:+ start:422 stop:985 length:564 start_codon:yes stop_codon:yes gene_type:complete